MMEYDFQWMLTLDGRQIFDGRQPSKEKTFN